MKSFIEDFNLIKIESQEYIDSVCLLGERLFFSHVEGSNQYFKSNNRIALEKANEITINDRNYPLYIGHVTLREDFNKTYRYSGDLGAIYTKEKTIFRVFSPVANNIKVVIDNKEYQMDYKNPIWEVTINLDLELKNYYYLVNLNQKEEKVTDPYALAGTFDYSTVIDINKTDDLKYNFVEQDSPLESIIYEGHIRDLTTFLNVPNKKLYLGVTEKASELKGKSVLEYIKDLGMTHLQLLPVQDFVEVDEYDKDKYYNWGYNPQSFFTITGWYSKDPSNPYLRINEFKQLVDSAHKLNLGIVLDVVYNHVYQRGMYPYDKLVPGYFYRHNKDFKATNAPLVGNEIETRNYMVRKLIVDSLVYLTKTFKLDGYRFDLMGIMDIETMLLIEDKLKDINPSIMLYGEGWNMVTEVSEDKRSNMRNNEFFPYYGHFNDYYRDVLKGGQHHMSKGYLAGARDRLFDVLMVLKGSSNIFFDSSQTINYIDCHDNHTYRDFLTLTNTNLDEIPYYLDFANHFIAISKGIPFYHAGQELYRTKRLERNTYNLDDSYNGIRWTIPNSLYNFKKILEIRKTYFNKEGEILATKFIKNLILFEVVNKKDHLRIYLKNDFRDNKIKENYKNIFASQEITKNQDMFLFNKPGIYIFKGER